MANYDEVTTQPQRKNSTVATGVSDQHWLITTKSNYNSSQKIIFQLVAPGLLAHCLTLMFQKIIQISIGMKWNFIYQFYIQISYGDICHIYLKFMFRKIIQISAGMKFIILCQLNKQISYGDW